MNLGELPRPVEDVLCVHATESAWTHEITAQSIEYTTRKQLDWLSSLCTRLGWGLHFAPSIESARSDLSRYRIVILPGYAFELSTLEREALRRFVDSGGAVLSLPRTAMKQKNNQMSPLPLCLFDEGAFYFEEHGALLPGERETFLPGEGAFAKFELQGHLWAEKIRVVDTLAWRAAATFQGGLYDGFPAVLRNATFFGGGVWVHLATCPLAGDDMFRWLTDVLGVPAGIRSITPYEQPFAPGPQPDHKDAHLAVPQGTVQVIPLALGARRFFGIVNFGDEPATVEPATRAKGPGFLRCLWARINEPDGEGKKTGLTLDASFWERSATPVATHTNTTTTKVTLAAHSVALLEVEADS